MNQTRERLLHAALELFAHNGFHAVGLDAVIDAAGVSKQTFYNHFESKDELVLASLQRRRETEQALFARLFLELGGPEPLGQLYANIDVIQAWFRRAEWRGCICIKAASEFPLPTDPVHRFVAAWFEENRRQQEHLATLAGARDPVKLSTQIMTIVEGVINVRHITGSEEGVQGAREMLRELLDRELAPAVAPPSHRFSSKDAGPQALRRSRGAGRAVGAG